MSILKEGIYAEVQRSMDEEQAGPVRLAHLSALVPNRRVSDLLLCLAFAQKMVLEEQMSDNGTIAALRRDILSLCRVETGEADWVKPLTGIDFGVVAYAVNAGNKERMRGLFGALQERGWWCIGAVARKPGDPGSETDTHIVFYAQPAERITDKSIVPGYLQGAFDFSKRVSFDAGSVKGWNALNVVRANSFFEGAPHDVLISFYFRPADKPKAA